MGTVPRGFPALPASRRHGTERECTGPYRLGREIPLVQDQNGIGGGRGGSGTQGRGDWHRRGRGGTVVPMSAPAGITEAEDVPPRVKSRGATGEFKTNWSELGGIDPYACCISGGIRGWFIGAKTGNIENIINHVKTRQHMMACKQETQRLSQQGGLVARPMPPPGVRDVSCAWPPDMRMHLYGMSDEAAEEEYQRLYSQFQHRRTRRREQQPNALDTRTVGPNMDPEAQRIVSPDVATWISAIASLVKEYRSKGANPLVCFSGDAYNPSLMSTITMGKQMVAVLNEIGVDVSCLGNHDFDYGLENLMKLNSRCNFPWLMANVMEAGTDAPYGGADKVWLRDWNGIKVGIVGLVEEEWLETLGAVNVEEMEYRDFFKVGRQLASELKAQGAELLIAVTHMREVNDRRLAAELPEFHIVLGGHDHHYVSAFIEPHNNLLVKSGTDFRDLSVVEVEFDEGSKDPRLSVERIPIDSSIPEDPAMKAIVDENLKVMGERMAEEVGETLEPLDGRFQTVRSRESNLGNFVTDVWRKEAKADMVITNSGSLRSDMIHPEGKLAIKDFVAVLPYIAPTVVLECTGAQVVAALENGVSQWPSLEGRFPQVSGLKFKFDPSKPPGQRIVPGSVFATEVGSEPEPIRDDHNYRVAVGKYLASGRDGFDVFASCKVLVDDEAGVVVPTTIRNHFLKLQVLNKMSRSHLALKPLASKWLERVDTSEKASFKSAVSFGNGSPNEERESWLGARKKDHGLAVRHPERGTFCIAPVVEGRIINVLEELQEGCTQ
ncbi:hypothetical protein VOLCADRAFT_103101 [Volvox carteri f. nagariensis]|uniref:5'-Nucleotidase C-terminal domain-containing protein n=1 Tax=Volvox carteri f. nagariensis TaxID=3068 RepID=D8TKM9_VOLCA|nr:uncharacterized protein VOLCADRAFT_103101 [Volvox carteri f. nagariensis]EFJ51913.1 hypothetical protein VOLCADRAFT_103101 [Volvox carteri f. nagariensis]|eukprot:XP_002946687.1 hypothetical protein VOLCADRAFT_103101 [Volvox carteri f. nagariensis]